MRAVTAPGSLVLEAWSAIKGCVRPRRPQAILSVWILTSPSQGREGVRRKLLDLSGIC